MSRDRSLCVFASGGDVPDMVLAGKVDKAHERIIWACAWAPDSQHFATGSRDKTVKVWRAGSEGVDCLATVAMPCPVTALDWAPAGTHGAAEVLAAGSEDGAIAVYAASAGSLDCWRIQVPSPPLSSPPPPPTRACCWRGASPFGACGGVARALRLARASAPQPLARAKGFGV